MTQNRKDDKQKYSCWKDKPGKGIDFFTVR